MVVYNDVDFKRLDSESEEEYQYRISGMKEEKGLTWDDIAAILNNGLGYNYTESRYRRQYNAYLKGYQTREKELASMTSEELDEYTLRKIEMQQERVRLGDVRNQFNAYVRKEARDQANRELIVKCVEKMAKEKPLVFPRTPAIPDFQGEAILCISDVHYGVAFENFLNKYSPEIAVERIKKLVDRTIAFCLTHDVSTLHVANLGDLIAGNIHLQIPLQSKENVIEQTMHVAELLAEALNALSRYFKVEYYSCLDNHSRIDANKETSMNNESYAYFIPWYLKARLAGNNGVHINDSLVDDDFITFTTKGHNVIGVHGHKDKPANIVKELSCLTKKYYSLAIMGHRHHFSADEQHGTVIVSNGSLMGTDEYAKDLRVDSHATQNLIIVTEENPCACLYRIVLD